MEVAETLPATTDVPTVQSSAALVDHPRLSLQFEDNIYSWVKGAILMLSFKLRFRRRIEVCAIVVLIANVAMCAMLLCLILTQSSDEAKLQTFSTPLFWQTIVNISILGGFCSIYVYFGARVNFSLGRQRACLAMWNLKFKEKTMLAECELERLNGTVGDSDAHADAHSDGNVKAFARAGVNAAVNAAVAAERKKQLNKLQHLKKTSDAISVCSELCAVNAEVNFCEVFGLKAETSLSVGVVSLLGSLFVTLAGIYINVEMQSHKTA